MNKIVKILMQRDGLSRADATFEFKAAQAAVEHGQDPEEVLLEDLGLEPDYIFDLLEGMI